MTLDAVGRITGWNPAAALAYGFAADDVVGQPFTTLAAEGTADELDALLTRALDGEEVAGVLSTQARKDLAALPVRLTIGLLKGPTGRTLGATVLVQVPAD